MIFRNFTADDHFEELGKVRKSLLLYQYFPILYHLSDAITALCSFEPPWPSTLFVREQQSSVPAKSNCNSLKASVNSSCEA